MKIGISNLAWNPEHNDAVFEVMHRKNVHGLELAPKKVFADLEIVDEAQLQAWNAQISPWNLEVMAFQAFLFGHPELQLFDPITRPMMIAYIKKIIELCQRCGASVMVYGAPKSRNTLGRSQEECHRVAVEAFREIGAFAASHGVCFCIEPNPTVYDCNFITNANEAAAMVREVGSDGFRLHLDAACMLLAADPIGPTIEEHIDILRHFHVSEPQLQDFSAPHLEVHQEAATALRKHSFSGWVSIEMLPSQDPIRSVEQALAMTLATYE